MTAVRRLTLANYGMHTADQIALVATPLVAALAFDAGARTIGVLVALQSSAHLFGSIPFGILVDQKQLRTLTIVSTVMSAIGFMVAATSIVFQTEFLFGVGVTLGGFGTVLFGLATLSILPKAVPHSALAGANAAIQIPRAICSFAVPLAVGLVVADVSSVTILAAAFVGAVFALTYSLALPTFEVDSKPTVSVLSRIVEGGRYVMGHSLLLPITLCSVFWNLAFAGLLVVLVPMIQQIYRFDPGSFGVALSAFGLAAIAGSWLSGRIANRIMPSFVLLFGPGSSLVSAAGLLLIDAESSEVLLYASFFLLGFGPSMWLVAQNSIRQLVSPPTLLGRVNAVIQTAIYGVRPLGALLGGGLAGTYGPRAALVFVVGAFACSFAVSLFSDLRRVGSYAALRNPSAEV